MHKHRLLIVGWVIFFLFAPLFGPAHGDEPKNLDGLISGILKNRPEKSGPASHATPRARPRTAQREPIVMGVRFHEYRDRTRFMIEMSDPVAVRSFILNRPNRVVIDLPKVSWKIPDAQRPGKGGVIKGYRFGLFRPGNSRFVIDLNRPVLVREALILPPQQGYGYRIVIDLIPATQTAFNRRAGWPADVQARERADEKVTITPKPRDAGRRRTVVIDPGHGGIDDGTTGVGGTHEKDLVLAEGRYVAEALKKRGYRVHMTRSTDTFISLRKRVALSRAWHADLFISIHADSNPDPSVSGLSIYSLSEKGSDDEARALARKENQSDTLAGVDLSGQAAAVAPILIDLAQRASMNKSSRFAEIALKHLNDVTTILPRRPHRSAGFRVLKAPDVPSVLIELGYLSNRQDARRMRTSLWRQSVADAIAKAVDRYFAGGGGRQAASTP